MESIELDIYIHASPQKVWEAISDHEGYASWPGVDEARILKPGREERNGAGASRKVRAKGITFIEDIVTFEPPSLLEYRVVKCNMPIRHEIGRMEVIPRGEGAEIYWITTFELALPIVGGVLCNLIKPFMEAGFNEGLMHVKKSLERGVRP